MKRIIVLLPLLLMLGCKEESKTTTQAYVPPQSYTPRFEKVKILSVKKPKRFRLKYEVIRTGEIRSVSSKRCGTWKAASVGSYYMADINQTGCSFTKALKKI